MSPRQRASLRGVYAITPATRDTARLVEQVGACMRGGVRLVQYRFKDLPPDLAHEQARALTAVCRAEAAMLIVNDSLELARAVGADGVHLGRDDGDVAQARRAWPAGIIGASCYADLDLARAAAVAGADYIGIGSVFASGTKPGAVRAPLSLLGRVRDACALPVAAIGGITLHNAREALDAGADMLAVIAALFDAPDLAASARALTRLFESQPSGVPHVRP